MIFFIPVIISAFSFPYFLIKAIRSENHEDYQKYTIYTAITFVILYAILLIKQ